MPDNAASTNLDVTGFNESGQVGVCNIHDWEQSHIQHIPTRTMPELSLPIPRDFFALPRLSAAGIERHRALGHDVANQFVRATKLKHGSIDWTLRSTTSTAVIYDGRDSGVPAFLARAVINTTLQEVIDLFQTTSVAETRRLQEEIQPLVLDKVRLHNITLPTPDHPFLYQSLNWSVIGTPFPSSVFRRRDFCYLEHQDVTVVEGQRAFIRAMKSIEIAGVPDLKEAYNVIRGDILHYGHMFVETDRPGVLELVSIYHIRPNGQAKGVFADMILSKAVEGHYRTLHNMERVVRGHHLSDLSFLDPCNMPSLHTQSNCQVCMRSFGRSRKAQCRHCAKIVCKDKCSAEWKLVKSGLQVQVRICTRCSSRSYNPPPPIDIAPEPIDIAPEPIDIAPEPIDIAPEPIDIAPEPIDSSADYPPSVISSHDVSSIVDDSALKTFVFKPNRVDPLAKTAFF
ncbi:unnamed protein product [Aphanomyces euteiches]